MSEAAEKQTALQFQPTEHPPSDVKAPEQSQCPKCQRRFRAGARYCPYDGEPLSGAESEERDALIGAVIDARYEVLAALGEGGMGVVYRVRHKALGREFALKALRADVAQEEHLGERFLREAQSAAAITHPNVCEITDFGELPGKRPYFVMELLTGEPLSTWLQREGRMPVERVVRLTGQIARALDAAHRANIVHRDLKPDNILLDVTPTDERVKVADFGLAQVAGQSRLTQPGVVFGTPHYMSPEQASGGHVDQRCDVYALGVVMYEMLTGKVPFEAETYMGVLSKHLYMEPAPPSSVVDVQEIGALEEIVLRCMRKKPEERYASMQDLLQDLTAIVRVEAGRVSIRPGHLRASDLPGPEPSGDTEDAMDFPSLRPRVSGLKLGLVAIVCLALAGVALAVLGREEQAASPSGEDELEEAALDLTAATSPNASETVTEAAEELVRRPESAGAQPAEPGSSPDKPEISEEPAKHPVVERPRPEGTHAAKLPESVDETDPQEPPKRLPSRKKPRNFQSSEIIDPWSQ